MPPGLGKPDAALENLSGFLWLDPALIAVAARHSEAAETPASSAAEIRTWLAGLPAGAKDECLSASSTNRGRPPFWSSAIRHRPDGHLHDRQLRQRRPPAHRPARFRRSDRRRRCVRGKTRRPARTPPPQNESDFPARQSGVAGQGVPLETREVVVNPIGSTTTGEGLEVHAWLDGKSPMRNSVKYPSSATNFMESGTMGSIRTNELNPVVYCFALSNARMAAAHRLPGLSGVGGPS